MSEITGIGIAGLAGLGASDDGAYVWVRHQLLDGSEQTLIYPAEALTQLVEAFGKAATLACAARAAGNSGIAAGGESPHVVRLKEITVTTSPAHDGPILRVVTADNLALALEAPWHLLPGFALQLESAVSAIRAQRRPLPAGDAGTQT